MNDGSEDMLEPENEEFQIGFNFCLNNFFFDIYLPFTQSLINQLKINSCYSDNRILQHIEENYDTLQEYLQDLIIPTANVSDADMSEPSVKYDFPSANVDDFFKRITALQTELLRINHKQLFESKLDSVVLKNLKKDAHKINDKTYTPVNTPKESASRNNVLSEESKSSIQHRNHPVRNIKIENDEVQKENKDFQKKVYKTS